MLFDIVIQLLVFGVVLGGIYAFASLNLGLSWGLMHVVNFANGEWIMLAMYSTYWLSIIFHFDPYLLIPIDILIGIGVGSVLQWLVFEPVSKRGGGALMTILSTFGISMLIIGLSQALWSQTIYTLPNPYVSTRIAVGSISVSEAHLFAFLLSILAMLAVYLFLKKTRTGKAILATSEITGDPVAAGLMGVNTPRIRILSMALSGATAGIAGAVIATFYYVYPSVGTTWSLIAFVVVILGGLGSFSGLLLGGIVVGVMEAMGNLLLGQAYGFILVYVVFLIVLYIRPRGFMGRV